MKTRYSIILYKTSRETYPVQEFIDKQSKRVQAKFVHATDLLLEYGPLVKMPLSKKIDKSLYELRFLGKDSIRILYTFKGKNIYLLHAFKKKTNKLSKRDLALAVERRATIA